MGLIDAAVGARLRSRRQALGLEVGEVAAALAITAPHLGRIEDGHARASAEQLLLLCRALDMRPVDIYRGLREPARDGADAPPPPLPGEEEPGR